MTKHTELEGSGALYSHITRTFMTGEERTAQYGNNFFLNTSDKMTDTVMASASKDYKHAVNMADFKSATDPNSIIVNGGYDGYFMLGQNRSSILNKLQGGSALYENPLIPPNTRIHVRLYKQQPDLGGAVGRNTVDDVYFSSTEEVAANYPKITVNLKEMVMGLETHQLDFMSSAKAEMQLASKAVLKLYTDLVKISYSNLSKGVQVSHQSFNLPIGTKVAIVGFVQASQIWLNTTLRKHLSPRTTFPKDLEKLEFELDGNPVVFAGGLSGILGEKALQNSSAYEYYNYLRENRMTDEDFTTFFPPDGRSYTQMILLDLTSKQFNAPGQLTVRSHFKGASSPENTYTFLCTIGQGVVTRNASKVWTVDQIP